MIEQLKYWDTELFLFLNGKHSGFWDFVMYYASDKFIWIPFYVLMVYLLYNYYGKKSIWILLFTGVLITLSDQLAVHAFKNVFERLRPCHNPDIQDMVHIVRGKCGGKYGFYSNHATNHFAIAVFINYFLRNKIRFFSILIFIWAALIGYSRIYLGVHYPGDVITGALAGSILAGIFILIYRKTVE